MRPWSGLAAMMLLLSMALWVASIASAHWNENQTGGRQMYAGPFEACAKDYTAGIDECRRVDDSCGTGFSNPIPNFVGLLSCDHVRTTRAFSVIALIFAGMAFVLTWLGYNSVYDIMYRLPAMFFSLLSFGCGLIAWSVWISTSRSNLGGDWNYGWSVGMALGAWLLPLAATIACLVPSPARDMSTGEILTKGAAHGRGGGWTDIFKREWWTRGADWGGRGDERGGLPPTSGVAGSGLPYTERARETGPPGTAYREAPGSMPTKQEEYRTGAATGTAGGATSYAYGESERRREYELERERAEREHGRPGLMESLKHPFESEGERLAREARERATSTMAGLGTTGGAGTAPSSMTHSYGNEPLGVGVGSSQLGAPSRESSHITTAE